MCTEDYVEERVNGNQGDANMHYLNMRAPTCLHETTGSLTLCLMEAAGYFI